MRHLSLLSAVLLLSALATQAGESKVKLTDEEQKVLELTNAERKKEMLPPLKINATLLRLAREHSKNMAKQSKMDHVLDDKTPKDRINDSKYAYRSFGENIAYGEGNFSVSEIMKGWMDSPPHRKNILGKDFTEVGVSLASNDKGETYYTQVFAKPRN
jgi:uncharacterized protein YkwD